MKILFTIILCLNFFESNTTTVCYAIDYNKYIKHYFVDPQLCLEEQYTEILYSLIRASEGISRINYYCSSNQPTIGWGHWNKEGFTFITLEQANSLLYSDVESIKTELRTKYKLSGGLLIAITSLSYGIGLGEELLKSQLFKELKKNSSKEIICRELRRWVYSCNKKSKKLSAVRELECKMIYENLELISK